LRASASMPIASPLILEAVPPTTVIKSTSDNTAIAIDAANGANLVFIIPLRDIDFMPGSFQGLV